MEYRRRFIDDELDELFSQVPAIAIDGPKAVGKTTKAHGLGKAWPRLEAGHSDDLGHDDDSRGHG